MVKWLACWTVHRGLWDQNPARAKICFRKGLAASLRSLANSGSIKYADHKLSVEGSLGRRERGLATDRHMPSLRK